MTSLPAPPHAAITDLQLAPSYVRGFPIHAGITIDVDVPGAAVRGLPYVTPFDTAGGVGVELRDPASGRAVVMQRPTARRAEWPRQGVVLHAGAPRRFLADLSDLLPENVPEGAYELVVLYGVHDLFAASEPARLRLAAAGDEHLAALALRGRARTWGEWVRLPPQPGDDPAASVAADDPLRFNRVMRYLFRGDQELTGDDLARLDALDGLYAPQAAALRAELLALLGDSAAAEAAAAVRQTWPALSWWIDDVEAGAGTIAWERRLRPHAS